jgi:hypothetical protein
LRGSKSRRKPALAQKQERIQILNIIIPLRLVTKNNKINKNTNKKTKTKTKNLSLAYDLNSPLFKELIKILTNSCALAQQQ